MPRVEPTTTWTPRTPPSTTWGTTRNFSLWFDRTAPTFDLDTLTWDQTLEWTVTFWETPRYEILVEDVDEINVSDLTGALVWAVTWNDVNVIDTIYT